MVDNKKWICRTFTNLQQIDLIYVSQAFQTNEKICKVDFKP